VLSLRKLLYRKKGLVMNKTSGINSFGVLTLFIVFGMLLTACNGSGNSGTSSAAAELTRIEVSPPLKTLPVGLTQQFTATGIYSDGSNQDITSEVTWSADSEVIVIRGGEGTFTASAPGTALISASLNGISSEDSSTSSTLSVTAAELVSIAVSPSNSATPLGLNADFTATGTYTDGSTQDITTLVTWESSAPATAMVSNASGSEGEVTPLATGTALISASLNGISSEDSSTSSTLSVSAAELLSITVTPSIESIMVGTTHQYAAMGIYTDSTTQNLTSSVTWSSSDNAVATVDNSASPGVATGVTIGTVNIDATEPTTGINASDSGEHASLDVVSNPYADYLAGYHDGYADYEPIGYNNGYDDGWNDGYNDAVAGNAYDDYYPSTAQGPAPDGSGYSAGYSDGTYDGEEDGYATGYGDGYSDGYTYGS
jgi:hypothetical protein